LEATTTLKHRTKRAWRFHNPWFEICEAKQPIIRIQPEV
jgi:hypothetical protein